MVKPVSLSARYLLTQVTLIFSVLKSHFNSVANHAFLLNLFPVLSFFQNKSVGFKTKLPG